MSSIENESARASTWRESTFDATPRPNETSATASAIAGSAAGPGRARRVAETLPPAERLGQRLGAERAGRRDERQPGQAAQQVVVLLVAELVRDDRAHLVAREALEQVVVEHDPLAVADADHVGVGRRRAAAGVDAVDLAHVDARLAASSSTSDAR